MAAPFATTPRPSFLDALAVYLQPRVLVILLLGFSGGVPIILVGSTLQAWMEVTGIDIRTIGLFAAVAILTTSSSCGRPWSTHSTCRCCRAGSGDVAAG